MSQVTAEMVQELRTRTGVGMAKCKQALDEAKGDMDLAIANLRKAGIAGAVKKADREVKEGTIVSAMNNQRLVLVEANAETDFVVKNAIFQQFAKDVADEVLRTGISDVEKLLAEHWSKDKSLTLDQYRAITMQKLGENIIIRRVMVMQRSPNTSVGLYSHSGGKIVTAVIISGSEGEEELAREVAMHVAAEAPEYLKPEEVPADVKAQEEEIARAQVKGKPDNVIQKILEGKLRAFYDQVCLVCQKFIKDPSVSVNERVQQRAKAINKPLEISGFVRWAVAQ
jgi:elongation factor Ts